jgi:hypothetical protein
MQIPSYPYVARVSNSSGAVRAVVALREGGTVQSQQFELISNPKNMKIFQPAIEHGLKASTFSKTCAGRTVRLAFRFKMGAADEVWFQYPDTYEITALAPLINTSGRKNSDKPQSRQRQNHHLEERRPAHLGNARPVPFAIP